MKKILKKIVAIAIILGMFGQSSINSFASYNYELENAKYYIFLEKKEIIDNIKGGEKIISKIDTFIKKVNDNKAKIIKEKVNKIILKINSKKTLSKKEEKILLILNYIKYKLKLRELIKAEQAKKDAFKNTLSESDTQKVNKELVKIQNNLLNSGVNYYENILGELEKYTNYEEKGNFKASVKVDMGEKAKGEFSLKLKDYISKNSGFDTQFKTKIEALIKATENGKELKAEITALLDYIIKDQNYYILLKNLKIVDEDDVFKIKNYISKIKEIASKNKYIHFEDKKSVELLNILKQLNPSNILKQGKTIASKPLFTAYKKVGNKYYLVPSKYACDTAKTLAQKFDPFNGSNCTESQYKNLLSDIADTKAEFYIDFSGRNTIIGFEADNIDDDLEKINGFVSFSDKYIEEIKIVVIPNQEKYKGEGAELHFVRAKNLDAKFFANSGKIDFRLKSSLDSFNRFKTIDLKYNAGDNFNGELSLKNRKITGKYSGKGYKSEYMGIITGKTNTSNQLSTFKLDNKYTSSSKYNPGKVNTTLEYSYGKYSFKNISISEGNKSDILISATIKNKKLTAGEIKIDIEKKEGKFDYDSYKMIYSGDFKKVVEGKIVLKNKNITGKTIAFKDNKEYLVITNKGRLEEDKFELNNKIKFAESPYQAAFNNFTGSVREAKNTKVFSDLTYIKNKINILIAQGKYLKDFVGENDKINFVALGEKEDNFKQIDGSDYKIKILVKDDMSMFQIMGYIVDEEGNKIAVLRGNYYMSTDNSPSSLFKIDGKYIENGDIIGKVKDFKKPKKVELNPESNFNIKIDTTSNNNNANIYFDYKENNKKIIEVELDNKSRRTYKKVKILKPLPNDTIELDKVIGNPYTY